MSGKSTPLASFPLEGTKRGIISVSHLEAPYGKNSESVVSIGISLGGEEELPDWKVHIPYSQIDNLIQALELAKKNRS